MKQEERTVCSHSFFDRVWCSTNGSVVSQRSSAITEAMQVFPFRASGQDGDGLRDDISRDAETLRFVGNSRDLITVLYRTRLL